MVILDILLPIVTRDVQTTKETETLEEEEITTTTVIITITRTTEETITTITEEMIIKETEAEVDLEIEITEIGPEKEVKKDGDLELIAHLHLIIEMLIWQKLSYLLTIGKDC